MVNQYTGNYIELDELLTYIKEYRGLVGHLPSKGTMANKFQVTPNTITNKLDLLVERGDVTWILTEGAKQKTSYKLN